MIRSTTPVESTRGESECQPLAPIPAWWSGFLFQVLNPRQVCMFVYLTMLTDRTGQCSPTIEQIREDLGLFSTSMVFEALSVLEELSFVTRERRTFPGTRAKRNVYRRPSCERTILSLLERNVIDGELRSARSQRGPASAEARALVDEGLRSTLGDEYARYEQTAPEDRREVLIELLRAMVQ